MLHKKSLFIKVVIAFAALSFVGSVSAAPTIYEPFNYPEGDTLLGGNDGGTGLSGTWSADNHWGDNGGTGLAWGSLETQGAAAHIYNGWADAQIGVDSSTSYNNLLADGGELWFSVIYDNTASNQRSLFALSSVGIAAGNGRLEADTVDETSVGIGFGRASDGMFYSKIWDDDNPEPDGNKVWGGNNLTGTPESHVSGSNNEAPIGTAFVVGRVQWGETDQDDDVVELYLPGEDRVRGDVVSTSEGVIADQSGLDFLGLNSLESSAESDYSIFDEIRVGATAEDVGVIPEPASLGLLALGGLLWFVRRRVRA